MRALHAAGAARGLSHEDLRAVAGVSSLKLLGRVECSRLIDRLNDDHPEPSGHRRPRRYPPGTIRNASDRQRTRISALSTDLNWPAETCAGWLRKRHRITDLARDAFSSATASKIIVQLEKALAKSSGSGTGVPAGQQAADDNVIGRRGDTETRRHGDTETRGHGDTEKEARSPSVISQSPLAINHFPNPEPAHARAAD